MFDFAWTEIALIGVVALVLIGPKDMPVAVKAVTNVIKKARRMAAEFQSHVDEMVRDTELAEVRQQINEIRNFDIRGEFERAVDSDGSLRRAFDDPLITPAPVPEVMAEPAAVTDATGDALTEALPELPPPAEPETQAEMTPAFIPPAIAEAAAAPAFIPPQAAQGSLSRPPYA